MTLQELIEAYHVWAEEYYRPQNPRKTKSTYNSIRAATKLLLEVVPADTPAESMNCAMLYEYQQTLARRQYARGSINLRVSNIAKMFRWAAHPVRSIVPEDVPLKLRMLEPLRPFRSAAVEPEPVEAVTLAKVQRTALHCSDKIRTIIAMQWYTGMRPGEACDMRHSWIDFDADPWLYRPREHKGAWRKTIRAIPLGPNARAVLSGWMERITGDVIFPGTLGRPIRQGSYGAYIRRVNRENGLDHWFPHMLRHAYAERLADEEGDGGMASKMMLGHADIRTTMIYLGRDPDAKAKAGLAEKFG